MPRVFMVAKMCDTPREIWKEDVRVSDVANEVIDQANSRYVAMVSLSGSEKKPSSFLVVNVLHDLENLELT